jgi:hypothetical protein
MIGSFIDMRLLDNLGPQRTCAFDRRVEVVDFEPEENAMARRGGVRVHEVGMVFLIPGVELQNEPTFAKESVV